MSKRLQGVFLGKRKTATAKLVVRSGSGEVLINRRPIDSFGDDILKQKVLAPLQIDQDFWKSHDFDIEARGGGVMALADASSMAIARALATHRSRTKKLLLEFDRSLLAGDPRQTEPKKPNRRSARRFKQKSYR